VGWRRARWVLQTAPLIRETWVPCRKRTASRTFILLPGLGLSGRYLHRLARKLSGNADVWIADFQGRSHTRVPVYSVANVAHAVGEWMQRKDILASIVVGHSYGAQVAVELAVKNPILVDRLVLIAPCIDPEGRTIWQQAWRLLRDAFREPVSLILIAAWCYLTNGFRAWKMLNEAMKVPLERFAAGLRQPTLVLRGAYDPVVPGRWAGELTGVIPEAVLVTVLRAGHGVVFSSPHAVADAVLTFAFDRPQGKPFVPPAGRVLSVAGRMNAARGPGSPR
jgi:2-hydroxy-6-oxonona-2,4-dienedioate hydrolase